jgi:hypothetical protein
MSYTVKEMNDKYNILEKTSETVIELETNEKAARDLCRKLNLGSGFNGWTPSFVAQKMRTTEEA